MRKFGKIAAIALLILSIFTRVAQADTAISFDTTNDVVNVVTVYPTTSMTQAQVLAEVSQAEPKVSKTSGQNSAILKAQDGTQIIALSQWQKQDLSSQSYAKEHIIDVSTPTPQTFACKVQHIETRTTSPSFNQGDVIMFSQFKMKPGKDQSELATYCYARDA